MSVPFKYRELGDFHKYYSGEAKAPYLTIFIGGNHEASGHMRELYYGGWAAPNIYYLGAANVVRLGPLRIAGMSGIFKKFDYRKPHFEQLPFSSDELRSVYHVRELDVRKLLHIRSQVDVGLSHDWPQGIEWLGDHESLFRVKEYFRVEAEDGTLGSPPAKEVLDWLRPQYWFSGHMHVKYACIKTFEDFKDASKEEITTAPGSASEAISTKNEDEIDLDLDDDAEFDEQPTADTDVEPSVSEDLRSLLPASFAKPPPKAITEPVNIPRPAVISNTTTHFLALDKILPNRDFLQLLEITPSTTPTSPSVLERPLQLSHDPEWLAITRAFASTDPTNNFPAPTSPPSSLAAIDEARTWVDEHIIAANKLIISPDSFTHTAPLYDAAVGHVVPGMPREYNNPQTVAFCEMLEIENYFADDEESQLERQKNPPVESQRMQRGGFHNSSGGRGGGRGRGRGGGRRGRGFGGRGGGRGGGRRWN
jgi:lariat debranching enzyme